MAQHLCSSSFYVFVNNTPQLICFLFG